MNTDFLNGLTGRELLVLGGPPVVAAAGLVVLTRVRPNIGWPLSLVTLLITGLVTTLLGDDTRSEELAGAARDGEVGPGDAPPGANGDTGHLTGRLGLVVVYRLETSLLLVAHVAATALLPWL